MKKTVVTGATGFIGRHLCSLLRAPNVLTRSPETVPSVQILFDRSGCFRWIPDREVPPPEALSGCDTVFHLAGEPVATGRWTKTKKARIVDSRVRISSRWKGTANLIKGLRAMQTPPSVLVAASAVGYYGSSPEDELTEESAPGSGFLADVCTEWEADEDQRLRQRPGNLEFE